MEIQLKPTSYQAQYFFFWKTLTIKPNNTKTRIPDPAPQLPH